MLSSLLYYTQAQTNHVESFVTTFTSLQRKVVGRARMVDSHCTCTQNLTATD